MLYQHEIIENHPRKTVYKFECSYPYIPNIGDIVWFPEEWKHGTQFKTTSVHHYLMDNFIVINVNKA